MYYTQNKKYFDSSSTLFPDDHPHTVEEALEPWVRASLVIDEFHLDGFHGCDGEYGLHNSRAQPAY